MLRFPARWRATIAAGVSAAALSLFEQCSYKYFARYVAGMRERHIDGEGLGATAVGSIVHAILESLDLGAPALDPRLAGGAGRPEPATAGSRTRG